MPDLTLADVLRELTALRATVDDQNRRIAELETAATTPADPPTAESDPDREFRVPEPSSADTQRPASRVLAPTGVSRRRLFGVAAASVAGATGVLAARPDVAAAADGTGLLLGQANDSVEPTTWARTPAAPVDPAEPILRMSTATAFTHSTGLEIELNGRGDGVRVIHNGPSDATSGTGAGVTVEMNSVSTVEPGVAVTSAGRNNAIEAVVTNTSQGLAGVRGTTRGIGFGVHGRSAFASPLTANNTTGAAVYGETDSSNAALLGDNTGPGGVAILGRAREETGNAVAVRAEQAGLGGALETEITNIANTAPAISATTTGTGSALTTSIANSSSAAAAITASTSGTGSALNASTTNSSSAAPTITATTTGTGPSVRATAKTTAVIARSTSGAGVDAKSTTGIGVVAAGATAPLRLVPPATTSTGAPTTGAHLKGEIYLDSDGAVFVCVRSGQPGRWSALNPGDPVTGGSGGGGTTPTDVRSFGFQLLGEAKRAFDSRSGSNRPPTGNGPGKKGLLEGDAGRTRTIDLTVAGDVPKDAPAALVNLTVTGTESEAGFVTLYPSSARRRPQTSSINWFGRGQNIANTTVVALSNGRVNAFASSPTHVIVDVIGYYL